MKNALKKKKIILNHGDQSKHMDRTNKSNLFCLLFLKTLIVLWPIRDRWNYHVTINKVLLYIFRKENKCVDRIVNLRIYSKSDFI